MNKEGLLELLRQFKADKLDETTLLNTISRAPYEKVGNFAHIDHHRAVRQGAYEVIFCPGKTLEQIVAIVGSMMKNGSDILATRADETIFNAIKQVAGNALFCAPARTVTINSPGTKTCNDIDRVGSVAILTAGTADINVAEEARVTAEFMGSKVQTVYDVGVAGIHRLFDNLDEIQSATAVIVVAGMDGALPSVVGGLLSAPVIAVPTSIGYGASFGGLAALLAMLNSCAVGVSVVNIDNGFAAGVIAHRINIQSTVTSKEGGCT